jgi:hypothetical protein
LETAASARWAAAFCSLRFAFTASTSSRGFNSRSRFAAHFTRGLPIQSCVIRICRFRSFARTIAGVGENQSADPRRRQIVADRPSQTATATDERSGTFQSLLSRLAEAGYLNLPRVRLALGIGEVVGNRHWRAID